MELSESDHLEIVAYWGDIFQQDRASFGQNWLKTNQQYQ